MAAFFFLVGVVACIILYAKESYGLLSFAIILTVINFWSWGIMHNFAVESAKRRPGGFSGGFFDFTNTDVDQIPDGFAWINAITAILLAIILIYSLL